MLDLRPNQRAINRFIGELTRNWDTGETLEICIRKTLNPMQHAFVDVSMNRTHNI